MAIKIKIGFIFSTAKNLEKYFQDLNYKNLIGKGHPLFKLVSKNHSQKMTAK